MNHYALGLKREIMLAVWVVAVLGSPLMAHCEIPCGIYDDPMRFEMIAEHIQTIEKSMNQILELQKNPGDNSNQLVRWIINKENHADALNEIVTQYFLRQRVTPVSPDQKQAYAMYTEKVVLLHKMMVYSMKCKQTTDLDYVAKLRQCLEDFRKAYMGLQKDTTADHAQGGHEHTH